MTNKNQPNVGEVLCELCWTRNICCATDSFIDCLYHRKIGIDKCEVLQQAITKLTEIIDGCLEKELEVKNNQMIGTIGFNEAIKISRTKLRKSGFLLNKGGENGK